MFSIVTGQDRRAGPWWRTWTTRSWGLYFHCRTECVSLYCRETIENIYLFILIGHDRVSRATWDLRERTALKDQRWVNPSSGPSSQSTGMFQNVNQSEMKGACEQVSEVLLKCSGAYMLIFGRSNTQSYFATLQLMQKPKYCTDFIC